MYDVYIVYETKAKLKSEIKHIKIEVEQKQDWKCGTELNSRWFNLK